MWKLRRSRSAARETRVCSHLHAVLFTLQFGGTLNCYRFRSVRQNNAHIVVSDRAGNPDFTSFVQAISFLTDGNQQAARLRVDDIKHAP